MAHMWGDVERGIETRREEMDRQRIAKLEKELADKDQKIESLEKRAERTKRELADMPKLEEDIIKERAKVTALDAKVRRSEARAESVEAELAMQEAAVAELSGMRTKLRALEQQTGYMKEQLQTETQRVVEKENHAQAVQQRLQKQLEEKSVLQRNFLSAQREAEMAKAEVVKVQADLDGMTSRTDVLIQSATADADELRTKARNLEKRVGQYDVIQRTFEEADEDREVANTRARELARQLAVEQQQKGTLESLVNHQTKVIADLKKEFTDLQEASKILAAKQEQSDLSLLMVRTGYSKVSGSDVESLKRQLMLEKREHQLLKQAHEDTRKELSALRMGMQVKGEFEKVQQALRAVPSPLENKFRTPKQMDTDNECITHTRMEELTPPQAHNHSPVWEGPHVERLTQHVTHVNLIHQDPVEKFLRSPPSTARVAPDSMRKEKDPLPKSLHSNSFLHPNAPGLRGRGWPVVTPPPTVRLTPQGQVSHGGTSNDGMSSAASTDGDWKKSWSDPKGEKEKEPSVQTGTFKLDRDASKNPFETSGVGWILERPSS